MRKWRVEYAVDAFGTWETEAETEEEAWKNFQKSWYAGKVTRPQDFGDLDINAVEIEEDEQ